jgi:hypothetical protein
MITIENFYPSELVCKHIFAVYGGDSLKFIDPRLKLWIEWFRATIDLPVTINNKDHDQRGYRCNLCDLVKSKTDKGDLYLSAHTRFQAIDFEVEDMGSEEIRQWIERHKKDMPVSIRIERGTNGWVHCDVCNNSYEKIIYFDS